MDKLDLILQKVTSIDNKVDSLERRMDSMEHRMDSMEHRMDSMEHRMDSIELKIDSMQEDITQMKGAILRINTRIDENINFAIRAIADGHIDLEQRFNLATIDRPTRENIHVRLISLESDVNQIKHKCTQCA